jgi:hypothetical protein
MLRGEHCQRRSVVLVCLTSRSPGLIGRFRLHQPVSEQLPEEGDLVEEPVTQETLARDFWPLWVLPIVGVGFGLFSATYLPDAITDFFLNKVAPFGFTFWLGTFFAYGWEVQRMWIQELPRKWAPWTLGGVLVFLVFVLGGPQTLISDPWMVGMIVFPGFRILMSYQKRRVAQGPYVAGNSRM